jgi:hypothetical protein
MPDLQLLPQLPAVLLGHGEHTLNAVKEIRIETDLGGPEKQIKELQQLPLALQQVPGEATGRGYRTGCPSRGMLS